MSILVSTIPFWEMVSVMVCSAGGGGDLGSGCGANYHDHAEDAV